MSRMPIRLRLSAAIAVAMSVLLAVIALFTYVRVQSDLDHTIDKGLRSRADDVAALVTQADSGLSQGSSARLTSSGESFAQILRRNGTVYDSTPEAARPALTASEVRNLSSAKIFGNRQVSGIEGEARLLASPVSAQGKSLVVVVGTSVDERTTASEGLLRAFLFGGPIAVLLASGAGYLLASIGLGPVEAMRRRAEHVKLGHGGEPLPLPQANDEIRRLGETLNAMLARLEESFERERAFVADASHELRTPFAVLKAELEVAQRGGGYSEPVGTALASAIEEVDHLSRLAEDLLLIARSGDRELAVKLEPTDVRLLLGGVADRYRERAAAEGRPLEVVVPHELWARLDPLRIRQAVGNLIDNALRYGKGGVRVSAEATGESLLISVSDEGPGFPGEFAEHAFERFTRADPARGRGGTGLGLAIVRAIAVAHGGDASIAEGETGATIVLQILL
jgi:signal transduction histidine kinase